MGYEETRELYVKVSNKSDFEKVKEIFEKYEFATTYVGDDGLSLKDVWVYVDEDTFNEARGEIAQAVPGCLLLASCEKYHSVGGYCGYDVFAKFPDISGEYEENGYDKTCPVNMSTVDSVKGCINWIKKAKISIGEAEEASVYKIWGKDFAKKESRKAKKSTSAESYLERLVVNNPVVIGEISENSKNIFRLCVIAKDDEAMVLIKNIIKNHYGTYGEEIIAKGSYIKEKNMLYFMAGDFYDPNEDGVLPSASYLIDSIRYYLQEECEYEEEDIEAVTNKYIIVSDEFELWPDKDECEGSCIPEEGRAEYYLGGDCEEFDPEEQSLYFGFYDFVEMYDAGIISNDNIPLNITDVLSFMRQYNFEMSAEEKAYISGFAK